MFTESDPSSSELNSNIGSPIAMISIPIATLSYPLIFCYSFPERFGFTDIFCLLSLSDFDFRRLFQNQLYLILWHHHNPVQNSDNEISRVDRDSATHDLFIRQTSTPKSNPISYLILHSQRDPAFCLSIRFHERYNGAPETA